ncbi:MAG: type VI secretion protein ImpB [Pseudomonadota bacterium]
MDHRDFQYLYLDFDSFFATAEQHFNPALREQPVGVIPLDSPHTGCIAVSREAKARGVKFGDRIEDGRKKVPDMVFVVARPDAYVRLHNRILEVVETCLPIAEVRSIDELVCTLLPSEARQAEDIARRIKQALAREFSPVLTCSIGIAKSELLAKIAAEMQKPNGLVPLPMADVAQRLHNLKLKDIPGVSTGIEKRLAKAGVHDFAGLWALGPKQARALWGSIEGERFWNGLHGHRVERPETQKRMFGHSRMLPFDWRTHEKMAICARQLTLSAGRRLRRAGMRATKLTLSVRGVRSLSDRSKNTAALRWSRECTFPAARDDHTFLEALTEALEEGRREARFKPRSTSVILHGLVGTDEVQSDLFTFQQNQTCQAPSRHKWELLSDTMDRLRATHGPAAVSLGPKQDIPGGYLGAKIAFGRIPKLEDFSEAQSEDGATHFCTH